MPRPRNTPQPVLIVVWKHEEPLLVRTLTPEDDVWELGEQLFKEFPDASHIRWYGMVNGLTRPGQWQEVHDYEQIIGTEKIGR